MNNGYQPLYIKGYQTGLVQNRQDFILPSDAYPVLENAYIFREKILRKSGVETVGRLQRNLTIAGFANLNLLTGLETTATLTPGSVNITDGGGDVWTEPVPPDGTLLKNGIASAGRVNYATGLLSGGPILNLTGSFSYYPGLPVMGLLNREKNEINDEQTVYFDTKYAYRFNGTTFQEFIPGFTWSGSDVNFFWPMNYWVTPNNSKVFWVTNFSGIAGDPIRYSAFEQDPTVWIDFAPTIDSVGTKLQQCLAMVPFRGRMVTFRTFEGATLAGATQFYQRIRWAAIGNPVSDVSTLFPLGTVNANAWRDDIRGQGGFLDIPTSQAIVAVGFVRDNLVIFCERSTWQLRYTGRSIAPFQIEKVNSELGTESTFGAVQFDTSLVGIGDKGIVQCDSYKSERIDIKIPELVFTFHDFLNGNLRVYGIRDFDNKLAYWSYPAQWDGDQTDTQDSLVKFPNRRLVYNYENDSWAIFRDSITAYGTIQKEDSMTWAQATFSWASANFPWIGEPELYPFVGGGNQQGYIFLMDQLQINQKSLYIKNITGNSPNITSLNIPDHNLEENYIIKIVNLLAIDPFFSLNNLNFKVHVVDKDNVEIYAYDPTTLRFTLAQINAAGTYLGAGEVLVRDNFTIQSKKFNFLDDGQNIQMGFVDILMNNTDNGAITVNVYQDYNNANPMNTDPNNINTSTGLPDSFFNSIIPTNVSINRGSDKNWQRVFINQRAAFITLEYTLNDTQMNGIEQESNVEIDAQILWTRRAGRQLPIGV